MDEPTSTPPENNVVSLKRKFGGTPPPKPAPTYVVTKRNTTTGDQSSEEIQGYLFSLMPTFMIASVPDASNLKEVIYGLPFSDLVDFHCVQES